MVDGETGYDLIFFQIRLTTRENRSLSIISMLFFELLQVAIGNLDKMSANPTEKEWYELYSIAQKQTLLGISFLGIERLPKEQRPPKTLLMQWFSIANHIKEMNEEQDKKSLAVANRFLKDGFKSVILKGQGIAQLYPDGKYRTPGDIDIWLDGTRESIYNYVKTFEPQTRAVYHNIAAPSIRGTEIEVHSTPSWMNSYCTNINLQRFFQQYATETFNNNEYLAVSDDGMLYYRKFPVPTLTFNRVFILVHIYRHLFGEGIGLRQLLDYYYVLCQGFTEEERRETLQVLASLKMLRFASAVMYVLQTVFGMDEKYLLLTPDIKEGRFLLNEIMLAGNFGHHDERIKRIANERALHVFLRRSIRNLRFIRSYPSEVLWTPLFKIWHYFMRMKWNGSK